jgi:hypothetical protein
MRPSSVAASGVFNLRDYAPVADGVTDDTPALQQCFAAAQQAGGGVVTIPPGEYAVAGQVPVPLSSHTTVLADGAQFHLPQALGDQARLVIFAGQDVVDFTWQGGFFAGHCFDHRNPPNTWEPNANTRIFVVTTAPGGLTEGLTFRGIGGRGVAGAVISVGGIPAADSEAEVRTFASDITVRDCRLQQCGKFMWDYGLLWQIIVWPEEYDAADVAMAHRYFSQDLIHRELCMAEGDDRVFFENGPDPLPLSDGGVGIGTVCFFGSSLPRNIVRGRRYHIVDTQPGFIRIADQPGGVPLTFADSAGATAGFIHNMQAAFYELFQPAGAGPGKGAVDLTCCRNTSLTGNVLSALGDTMHLQRCHNNVFANNQITGSRMGAFFLAEYCKNSTVIGNTVDGTNGSRVMSVEKSSEDVTIVGNTFRGGGRGSWINQPRNIIFEGNVFINNTTKCERDPWRGRKSFETGDYEQYSEMYFTVHETGGQYGPVILRGNIFDTGPECAHALWFAGNGHGLLVEGNVFEGASHTVHVEPGCTGVHLGANVGLVD